MIARVTTGALWGIDAYRVDVEVSLTQGLPNVFVIGLPDGAVREARMRIEAARRALGLNMPNKRVTFSLAPCDRRKAGCAFDLPMAVALLAANQEVPPESTIDVAFAGELSLNGELRPIRGVLAQARLAAAEGCSSIVVPRENAREAAVIPGIEVFAAANLLEVMEHLRGKERIGPMSPEAPRFSTYDEGLDLLDVRGQPVARRALEVAAAGGHHLIYVGPPGTGKSMLARRLPGLLPPMTLDESLAVTQIYSAAGLLGERPLVEHRPFRAPHHTATEAALIGGGHHLVRVGEISLAHLGVLFLDETAEYPRSLLEALREPIENGEVDICRADHRVRLPARAQLVLALNPCPCGFRGQEARGRVCTCTPAAAERYTRRLSGPLLDRIDVQLELDPVGMEDLQGPADGEPSVVVRERVTAARRRQLARLPPAGRPRVNAWMTPKETREHCSLEPEARSLLLSRADGHSLSARGLDRVLRVARTLADLAGAERLRAVDVLEALSYRSLDHLLRGGQTAAPPPRAKGGGRKKRPSKALELPRLRRPRALRDWEPEGVRDPALEGVRVAPGANGEND